MPKPPIARTLGETLNYYHDEMAGVPVHQPGCTCDPAVARTFDGTVVDVFHEPECALSLRWRAAGARSRPGVRIKADPDLLDSDAFPKRPTRDRPSGPAARPWPDRRPHLYRAWCWLLGPHLHRAWLNRQIDKGRAR